MAARPGQRPNGMPRDKICQFKLVLLGKNFISRDLLSLTVICIYSIAISSVQ